MRKLRQATARGFGALSKAISHQTNYDSDVSTDYLAALGKKVDEGKPEGFHLTPISDSGW
jgi:hypothetical protein